MDKSHLKDHFYATAVELRITSKERSDWVKPRVKSISEGDVSGVLKKLKKMYSENENGRLKKFIGYIERFHDALDYDSFKQRGYPVGSREIESAHKYVPQRK